MLVRGHAVRSRRSMSSQADGKSRSRRLRPLSAEEKYQIWQQLLTRERAQERAPVGPQQLVGNIDDAVVKQRRLDPLEPARALVDQRLAQPGLRAPLAYVRGRDPRLRQAALGEQRPQP